MPWILTVRDGDRTLHFDLPAGEHILGSADECSLRLGHPTISRRHARLFVTEKQVEVEDLGSTNGTRLVDRELVGRTDVAPGKRLVFGSVESRLELVDAADVEAAMTFEDMGDSDDTEPIPIFRTTAVTGSLRWFVLDRLPLIVDQLEEGSDAVAMAQTVGEALFAALPCDHLEIELLTASEDHGVVCTVGEVTAPAPAELKAEVGPARVRIVFRHEVQARGYKSLVTTAARLVALVSLDEPVNEPVPFRKAPPLPAPVSVNGAVRRLYTDAARVAQGDVSVLVTGEPGTGKDVLARYIHSASPQAERRFVDLNCALPKELLEAELFGLEGEDRPGKFELADGGTLYLDEIGDIAPEIQASMLRVLQKQEVYRVGGREPRPTRVRVIAATHHNIQNLIRDGRFRSDLYHYLADWPVEMPPLRHRREDVPNLAAHFLKEAAARHARRIAGISRGALEALAAYAWPGNVRQLQREMERVALFLEDRELLQSRHLQAAIQEALHQPAEPQDLKARLEACERNILRDAIHSSEGNMSAVARHLGIGRSTLYRRLKELDLEGEVRQLTRND